ncbi:MAG: prepilin-type N-terminal cleavage/methylation domain-containing protein [Aphanothece sp. CMT-3BRIN-NPC111]|jgi:type II secretory pathway pseudopilin PulG|nr:prepilin-type N-terminal cleavage/methylation domain-containing protein [Aphanothece sp. CMT-3BRIN-NPC111]
MLLFIAHSKSRFFFSLEPSKNIKGFTLIEALIIVAIVGILSAIAAPSFLSMYNRSQTNSALNQTRGALQEAQRQAIRYSKNCTVALTTGSTAKLSSNCFESADQFIKASASAASSSTSITVTSLSAAIPSGTTLVFSGGGVATLTANAAKAATSLSVSATSTAIASGEMARLVALPSKVTMATNITNTRVIFDFLGTVSLGTTGTIVFLPTDGGAQKKCLVVSSPLGLIRTGDYSGATATATDVTNGTCTTSR